MRSAGGGKVTPRSEPPRTGHAADAFVAAEAPVFEHRRHHHRRFRSSARDTHDRYAAMSESKATTAATRNSTKRQWRIVRKTRSLPLALEVLLLVQYVTATRRLQNISFSPHQSGRRVPHPLPNRPPFHDVACRVRLIQWLLPSESLTSLTQTSYSGTAPIGRSGPAMESAFH